MIILTGLKCNLTFLIQGQATNKSKIDIMLKEKQEQLESQISYLYSQNNPASLVVLSSFQIIIRKMFKRIFNQIVWIHNYPTIQEVRFIELELQLNIQCFQDIQQTIQYWQEIDKKEENGRLIIISPSRFRNKLANLARYGSVAKILLFEKVNKNTAFQSHIDQDQQNSSIYSKSEEVNIQSFDDIFSYIYSKDQLLKELKQWRKEVLESQLMPSFISLRGNSWSSNAIFKSIVAMIKQPIDQQTRSKIAEKLLNVMLSIAESCFQYSPYIKAIKSFVKEIKNNQLSTDRAIFWYTVQSPIYKFVNNILRFTTSPTQIFYIQPFFKDLYQAVKKMYNISHKNQKKHEKVLCYRGGKITIEEVKMLRDSTGTIIQNLGFLSTSKIQNVANTYVKNTMFSIIVEQKSACKTDIGGYTAIKFQSCYYSEQEVLFNPLNNFRVIEFSLKMYVKGEQKYWISMEYNKEVKFETANDGIYDADKNVQYLLNYQQNVEREIICQGDALCFFEQVLQNSRHYWQKYIQIFCHIFQTLNNQNLILIKKQISRSSEDRKKALLKSAEVLFFMHENNRAFEFLQQVIRKSEDQWHISRQMFENNQNSMQIYFKALIRAGNVCYYFKKLQIALSFYMIAKTVDSIMLPSKLLRKIGVRCCISNVHSLLGKQHVALQDYLQCLELIKSHQANYLEYSSILNNIGNLYQILDQNTQALVSFKQSLRVKAAILGKFHPSYIITRLNISRVYLEQSYLSKAKQIYHECLLLLTTNSYLITYQNITYICLGIAKCQKYQGNTSQALHYYAQLRQHLLQFKNPILIYKYAETFKDQAFIYFLQDQYQKSWHRFKLAQKICKKNEKSEQAISEIEIMKTFILIRLEVLKLAQKQNRRLKKLKYYYEAYNKQTRNKYYRKFKLKIQKMKQRKKTINLFIEFQSI